MQILADNLALNAKISDEEFLEWEISDIARKPQPLSWILGTRANFEAKRGRARTFGNREGLQLLDELHKLRADFDQFKKHSADQDRAMEDLQENSMGYLQYRSRYLDTYLQDILEDDSRATQITNANEHRDPFR
ncbi:hypothetical protein FQN54_002507 [Arachnomyces sp. PD_36]|nr:hypothetical protein FQN54_002507 [Arachnomyces sp. PD_36]